MKNKNKKGQMTVIIMIIGFSVLALLMVSSAYISSLGLRGVNQANNRQLDELTEGSTYYAISYLKKEIDYKSPKEGSSDKQEQIKYNFSLKGENAYLKPIINVFKETDSNFNYTKTENFNEVGTFEKSIYLNTAKNACFQINWDRDPVTGQYATVTFSVDRVYKNADGSEKYIEIQLPVSESDGQIGMDPSVCTDNIVERKDPYAVGSDIAINPSSISSKLIYDITDANNVYMKNGYGEYRITVSATNGTPVNLQTVGIYNRLSYRTFEINAVSGFKDITKNNMKVIVEARYNDSDPTNVVPKFKILKWHEGDE